MKKYILLLTLAFFFFSNQIKAQWVAIPQPFATYISTYVDPVAINGNLLDTTNISIISPTDFTINGNSSLTDISGIQYFKALQNLAINYNYVVSLPLLPPALQTLSVAGNLQSFSAAFPNTITALKFYSCSFTTMPAMPASLQKLIINYTPVTSLPVFPDSLYSADLTGCSSLTTLLSLDSYLQLLTCDYTGITSLPALPDTLNTLSLIDDTVITALPPLNAQLGSLYLNYTRLTAGLPPIPASLRYLYISHTNYTLNQNLSNLWSLRCSYCPNITSLPASLYAYDVYADHCNITSTSNWNGLYMDNLVLSNNPLTSLQLPGIIMYDIIFDSMPNLTNIILDTSGRLDFFPYGNCAALSSGYLSASACPHASAAIYNLLAHTYGDGFYCGSEGIGAGLYPVGISCENDSLTAIPQLHAFLYYLNLSYNQITNLSTQLLQTDTIVVNPGQIDSWDVIRTYCPCDGNIRVLLSHNLIDSINPLFFNRSGQGQGYGTTINELDLSYNKLSVINWLPQTLFAPYDTTQSGGMLLSNNQITQINTGVYTDTLDVRNNPALSCLPFLYGTKFLYSQGTAATCTANIPENIWVSDMGLGVCQPGNPNHCPVESETGGLTFSDSNQNGLLGAGEPGIGGIYLTMQPDNFMHVSDTTGHYVFQCAPATTYTITALPTLPYRIVTTPPYTEYFSTFGIVDTFKNMGIYTMPDVNDIVVYLTPYGPPKPGFHQEYSAVALNQGTTLENGNLVMTFDTSLWFQSATPAGIVNGNTITWPITNLAPTQSFSATLDFIVPVPVPLGTYIYAALRADCNPNDTTPLNNYDSLSMYAVGSYDPNHKSVQPTGGLTQQQIAAGDYLTYTVAFQNTGTASATTVKIVDSLSSWLDISTFGFIASSKVTSWSIDNDVLTVTFNNINLPDSAQSQTGSQGFFTFRIRPFVITPIGQQISNTASIYFDFNTAIVTDTVESVIGTFITQQPVAQVLCSGEPLLLTIATTSPAAISWYRDSVFTGVTGDTLLIDSVTAAQGGIYYCKITTTGGVFYSQQVAVQVTDHAALPVFRFTQSDTVRICNSNYSYNATIYTTSVANMPESPVYNWYYNDSLIFSGSDFWAISFAHFVNNGDRLSCYVPSSCTQLYAGDSILFLNQPQPVITITPDTIRVCTTQNVTLTAQLQNLGTYPYTDWYLNNVFQGNESVITIPSVSSSDSVYVLVGQNVCTGANARINIPIISDASAPMPVANVQIAPAPDSAWCPGMAATFDATGSPLGPNPVYMWSVNGTSFVDNSSFIRGTWPPNTVLQCRIARTGCSIVDTVTGSLVIEADTATLTGKITDYTYGNCKQPSDYQCAVAGLPGQLSYVWKVNGIVAGTQSYFQFQRLRGVADTIACIVTTSVSCFAPVTTTLLLPAYEADTNFIITESDAQYALCPTDYASFKPVETLYDTLTWFKNGTEVFSSPGDEDYSSNTDSTDYSVYATQVSTNGCYVDTSNTLNIHIIPAGQTATLQIITGPIAYCGDNVSFTAQSNFASLGTADWYRNDTFFTNTGVFTPSTYYPIYQGEWLKCVYTPYSECATANTTVTDSIQINMVSQQASVSLDSSLAYLCSTQQQTFTAQIQYGGSSPVYTWYKNGIQVGTNSATYHDNAVTTSDKIWCSMQTDNPCASPSIAWSDTLYMVVETPDTPAIAVNLQSAFVCQGYNATLTASAATAGSNPVYQWQVNGTNAGINSPAFTSNNLQDGDTVICILISNSTCALSSTVVSAPVVLTVHPVLQPSVVISNNTIWCGSDTLLLMCFPVNEGLRPNYQWYFNGAPVDTSSTNYIGNNLSTGDVITCRLISGYECAVPDTVYSNLDTITIKPLPTAVATLTGSDTLTSTSAIAYQWYFNGVLLTGDTDQVLIATEPGNYQVQITGANGCINTSAKVPVSLVGIANITGSAGINIYPDPATDQLFIKTENINPQTIAIYDVDGRLINTQPFKTEVDVTLLSSGVYFIEVQSGEGVVRKKFVKM